MRVKPALVLAIAIGAWSVVATAQRPNRAETVQAKVERLQSRLERVESIRAIKRLQYAYGHYVELGLWNDFADLFTDDAKTNYQQGAQGRAQIRKLFFDQVGQGRLGLADGRIYPHILFQPVIHLAPDGRSAKGRWRILAMLGGYGGSATWYSGVYENEYVLQDGVWKISVLRSEPKATAAYTAKGWKDSGVHIPFHYTAASAAAPISDPASGSPAGSNATSLADRAAELVRRAARLTDQAEVTNLQDAYGFAIDRTRWDQAAGLFADNGTLELGLQGVYVGKASIRRALDQLGPPGLREEELNDHVYLQTLVSVAPNGRTANARGVELIFSNTPDGRSGELSEGVFENTFIKQNGAWKIQSVHFFPRMIVDAATGWAKSAKPAPGPSKQLPPDRPPTSSYEIYPKFAVAPFHFDNPVTGKPPQYPEGAQAFAHVTATALPIRSTGDVEASVGALERSITAAEAYDAAENLIGAYGYYTDKSSTVAVAMPADIASLFGRDARKPQPGAPQTMRVEQLSQPVIQVSRDGKSVKLKARLLELGSNPNGTGTWAAGIFDEEAVQQDGTWKFRVLELDRTWGGSYPGGWARTQ